MNAPAPAPAEDSPVSQGNLEHAAAGETHEFTLPQALQLAGKMLAAGHLEPAEEVCTLILQNWENHPEGLHLAGVLRHLQGRHSEAVELIAYAITQMPENARVHNSFGNVLGKLNRLDEAVQTFQQAIALTEDPGELADAYNNLGRMYRKLGRLGEAEDAARKSLEYRPDNAVAWHNLSLVLIKSDKVREGILANSKSIALWPRDRQRRDSVVRALVLIGELDEAAKLYREWLADEPDNEVVKHHLAACLNQGAPERASDKYVETVFDRFSSSFDDKLKHLQYRAPEYVAEALARAAGGPKGGLDIADAGCGTGLCGPLVKPWARRLVGFDLSAGMLEKAAPREVYDELHKAELVHFLETHPAAYDVVISADTLCYFGELDGATRASAQALRSGGLLIYTVEALPADATEGHRITTSGRYAHGRAYVEASLRSAGFEIVSIDAVVLRMEAGVPVDGWLVTGRKA